MEALYLDANASRAVDALDVVALRFDRPVRLALGAAPDLLETLAPGDVWGAGATLGQRVPGSSTVELALGAGARLSIFDTFIPGALGPPQGRVAPVSPSPRPGTLADLASLDPVRGEPVRIQAARGSRYRYAGEAVEGQFRPWSGNLHAHTGYSDGAGDPATAFAYARDVGRLDFMAVTDHMEQLAIPLNQNLQFRAFEWDLLRRQADTANQDGRFVAIAGYEWAGFDVRRTVIVNHTNWLGTDRLMPLTTLTVADLHREAPLHPLGTVAMFNHPVLGKPFPYTNWDDFRHVPESDAVFSLIECDGRKQLEAAGYVPALERGWHLGPVSSQDNHHADWGTADEGRAGVWAAGLTRPGILDALAASRVFSSGDRNAHLRLLADGRWWMGSTLHGPGPHLLEAVAEDPDTSEGFAVLELVGAGGAVVASRRPGAPENPIRLQFPVDPAGDAWFYARARQVDGDLLVSAPVWLDR